MILGRAFKVGAALCVLSMTLGPALACGSFDETSASTASGSDGAPDGDRSEAAIDGSGSLVDAPAPGDGAPDAVVDAPGDADAGVLAFGPACTPQDTVETEPNDTAGTADAFDSSVCGTLVSATDVDELTFDVNDTAPFTVAFACTGDARFMIALPSGSFTSGNNTAGSFVTKTFPGVSAPRKYAVKIFGGEVQDWRLVVQR